MERAGRFCDFCGRDVPEEEIAFRRSRARGKTLLCPECGRRARARTLGRLWIAAAFLAVAAGVWITVFRTAPRKAPPDPPGDDPGAALAALRTELAALRRRIAEAEDSPAGGPPAGVAEAVSRLSTELEKARRAQEALAQRLEALDASPVASAPPPPAETSPRAPPDIPDASQDRIAAARARLVSDNPRERLAALEALGAMEGTALSAEVAARLSDPFGYVRRAAAETAARLTLRDLAPALLARLETEEDPLARHAICRALAAFTGVPYDPFADTEEKREAKRALWKQRLSEMARAPPDAE